MKPFHADLRCAAGCDSVHRFDAVVHRCPACGGLMQIAHDLDALAGRSAGEWTTLFDARFRRGPWPYTSGVWGKKEWVAPSIRDEHVVSMGEGATALLPAGSFGAAIGLDDLWIKQCGTSHSGSFKDLGMTVLVSTVKQMIADGAGVRAVACASTGDTSAALAAYAAAAGLPAIVILPRGKVTRAQLVQPLSNGATVFALDTDFDGCMQIIERLAATDGLYLANSLNSVRLEGQKTVAIEIAQQFDWQVPDTVVVPGGNLGNVSALYAGFEMMRALGVTARLPRLVVAQAEAANPLYRAFLKEWQFEPVAARATHASAIQIGNPVSFPRAVRALRATSGLVEQAGERELAAAAVAADAAGFFTCPQTAVALAVVRKLAARGAIGRDERVVVLSTASGLKFVEFKLSAGANAAIELPGDYDAVRRALDTAVPA
jgi:threonine synthase